MFLNSNFVCFPPPNHLWSINNVFVTCCVIGFICAPLYACVCVCVCMCVKVGGFCFKRVQIKKRSCLQGFFHGIIGNKGLGNKSDKLLFWGKVFCEIGGFLKVGTDLKAQFF